MSKLKSIAIKGFRSFGEEVEVPLGPLNVLIGANGSGKSNFLEAFRFLCAFAEGRPGSFVERAGGADRILHFGARTTNQADISVTFADNDGYTVKLYRGEGDRIFPEDEFHFLGMQKLPDIGDRKRNTQKRLLSWRVYQFHDTSADSPIKKTCNVDDNRYLKPNGSNLAAFLYLLREKHSAEYRTICRTVRLAAPFFEDFALEPRALNRKTIILEWRHKGSDSYFNADALSDGTLRFMALATLLLQPRELRPDIVLIDEPELGLHPYAIAILAGMFRSISHEAQIVAATQSPILLDRFEPEDVLVADRIEGQTRIGRLDADELGEWLEDYSLGELWEKNHFGGRPVSEKSAAE